jgi:hypothetical protein
MPATISTITDLLELVIANPSMARVLKEDPDRVARMFGVRLTKAEAAKIKAKLDVQKIATAAKTADTMAMKAAQGIGLTATRKR